MITVAGEALMDVLVDASGRVTAHPGGAPFNVARLVARLGADCQFLGRLSGDAFGRRLRASLQQRRVRLAVPEASSAPTTLAVAELDQGGSADYRFYIEGTAAAELEPADIPAGVLRDSTAVAVGGLGILVEPMASSLLGLMLQAPDAATVLLDPNGRPRAVPNLARYRSAVSAFLGRADVVKASAEDLRLLYPDTDARQAARRLLELGPSAVLVTDGPAPVAVHTAAGESSVGVPEVRVVDTVGAGDAFAAGFLTWWADRALTRGDTGDPRALAGAAEAAVRVAAAACTVRGADLPEDFRLSR